MTRRRPSLDESDVRIRPSRGTRPRSKLRPSHEQALPATVVAVARGRYTCLLAGGADLTVTAMKARELGRQGVVVGDRVEVVGDVTGGQGSLARVVRVAPRTTVLRRTADDDDPVERVVVANADQLVVVTALADPEPRPRLVDRCLVAAYDAGMDALLCLTKSDLRSPDGLLGMYAPLGVRAAVTGRGSGLDALRDRLTGRVSVLVGHSGVGKSTLVNALVPGASRATAAVNAVTGRGRHTSASAVALRLPQGGWVIDTPGIRSFGLAHVDPSNLVRAFPDLASAAVDCPRGCAHGDGESECALDAAVAAGELPGRRVYSFRRLLSSRERQAGD